MTQTMIRHFTYYFKRMMKFYDLKVQGVPQVVFILLLLASFGARFVAQPYVTEMTIYYQQWVSMYGDAVSSGDLTDPQVMENVMHIMLSDEFSMLVNTMLKLTGLFVLQQVVMMLLSFFYLGAYLVDMETSKPVITQYMSKFIHALPRYIGFNVIFYLGVGILFALSIPLASFLIMILPLFYIILYVFPWFLIQIIFIFKDITFLDTGVGIFRNFSLAWKLSAQNRLIIGKNIFFIIFLNMIINMVSVGTNVLISMFVVSFFEVIVLLIQQRLIVLMYLSRTRRIQTMSSAGD